MISLNRRHFQTLSREELYAAVGEVIGERWKVRSSLRWIATTTSQPPMRGAR